MFLFLFNSFALDNLTVSFDIYGQKLEYGNWPNGFEGKVNIIVLSAFRFIARIYEFRKNFERFWKYSNYGKDNHNFQEEKY